MTEPQGNAIDTAPVKAPPQLPAGTASTLRGVTENFSFHASPESFIASKIQQLQSSDPTILDRRTPVRAKILNRNVAIISSYHQIQAILDAESEKGSDDPPYIAARAYDELMRDFFPPPNILLSDGCPHRSMRKPWDARMKRIGDLSSLISDIMSSLFAGGAAEARVNCISLNAEVDLYEAMKTLAWRVLLRAFLGLRPDDSLFHQVQSLHEYLLRGQFSLMPVSINTGFWRSPRSRGIQARRRLQKLISERLKVLRKSGRGCAQSCARPVPEDIYAEVTFEQIRDHILMMTSSLAVKGLASLFTAFMLNLFLFDKHGVRVVDELTAMTGPDAVQQRRQYLRCIYLETERLSPPIVGIMRRAARDMVVQGVDGGADVLLPSGWDVWLYFVGGGRDPEVFGATCNSFDPHRYNNRNTVHPLGFGAGPKSCLGVAFVREVILLVAEWLLDHRTTMKGTEPRIGVRAWLGWEDASPKQWAADMKQLPTQHPSAPVIVSFVQQ